MTTIVTNPTENEELSPEPQEKEPTTHIGRQILEIRRQLGSIDQRLSFERLARALANEPTMHVEVSGSALRGYQEGIRKPPLDVVEALSKIDPRKYTPGQIAGWDPIPEHPVGRTRRRGTAHTKTPPTDEGRRGERGA